jgi:surface protein
MQEMFKNAESFNQDINNWDVSNDTNMKRMFDGTKSLTKLPEWYKKN